MSFESSSVFARKAPRQDICYSPLQFPCGKRKKIGRSLSFARLHTSENDIGKLDPKFPLFAFEAGPEFALIY